MESFWAMSFSGCLSVSSVNRWLHSCTSLPGRPSMAVPVSRSSGVLHKDRQSVAWADSRYHTTGSSKNTCFSRNYLCTRVSFTCSCNTHIAFKDRMAFTDDRHIALEINHCCGICGQRCRFDPLMTDREKIFYLIVAP